MRTAPPVRPKANRLTHASSAFLASRRPRLQPPTTHINPFQLLNRVPLAGHRRLVSRHTLGARPALADPRCRLQGVRVASQEIDVVRFRLPLLLSRHLPRWSLAAPPAMGEPHLLGVLLRRQPRQLVRRSPASHVHRWPLRRLARTPLKLPSACYPRR